MAQNLREQISDQIIDTLRTLTDPRPVLVTREPFEPDRLAITQFPALLVQATREERNTITMGMSTSQRKQGTITYAIRGYVRGTELDRLRNDLIEAIDEALDGDRYRGKDGYTVTESQVTVIEIIERLPPLAEFRIEFEVNYNYVRGSA